MSRQRRYLIQGPVDPSLYDGDTPLLVVLDQPLHVYRVEVEYEVRHAEVQTIELAAPEGVLAEYLAWVLAERHAAPGEVNHRPRSVTALDREPTEAEVMAWVQARGGKS